MNTIKITGFFLMIATAWIPYTFAFGGTHEVTPAPITRSIKMDKNGSEVIITQVLLEKSTTREELIKACSFLAGEDVQLTFELLQIRKSFFGLFCRPRIAYAKGMIALPGGFIQKFKAGGLTGFKSIKITYSKNSWSQNYLINMIEIID